MARQGVWLGRWTCRVHWSANWIEHRSAASTSVAGGEMCLGALTLEMIACSPMLDDVHDGEKRDGCTEAKCELSHEVG